MIICNANCYQSREKGLENMKCVPSAWEMQQLNQTPEAWGWNRLNQLGLKALTAIKNIYTQREIGLSKERDCEKR